ncbi:Putative metal-dependent hydrolase, composite domain superfamily [Colletotrichum destructivum]|uniref:Metal-dependent hydrolase, composite domain superfamily n=1 Tax=Colletotrichum destructivum TaxID=34406 RepID=A0AAX4IY02_9PEZI|nr:Putative metal-dependent hydrolase, composite domain superfamily [Colletotrichum destructivum]
MAGKYLITGGLVVTLDNTLGDFDNGAVLVQDGIIKAVGKAEDISDPDAEIIDASEGVVIPGMVDTHRHVSMSLTRGIGVDQHLWHFLANTYTRWLPATGVEDMRISALVGALEAIDSGVTTIMDTCESFHSPEHAEAELQGLKDSGIRAFFCYGMSADQYGDVPAGKAGWDARMSHVASMVQENDQEGVVRVALQLSQSGTTPLSWINDELRLARDHELFCCSHTSAVPNSSLTNDLETRADFGHMHPGHVYIHCTSLTDHEMSLIAKTGGKIALAPDTDIQMGMGFPPLRMALAHGLKPALSIDTSSAAPPDLLSQMRLQLQVQRGLDHQATHLGRRVALNMNLGARDALIWGTRNGAEAVGLGDKIGTLSPGKRADVVVITSKRALSGTANPLGTAVLHSTPADVDLVMVDGKIVKRDGQLVGVDVPAIRAKAREGLRRIQENLKKARPEMSAEEIEEFFRQGEKAHRINISEAYAHGVKVEDYLRKL